MVYTHHKGNTNNIKKQVHCILFYTPLPILSVRIPQKNTAPTLRSRQGVDSVYYVKLFIMESGCGEVMLAQILGVFFLLKHMPVQKAIVTMENLGDFLELPTLFLSNSQYNPLILWVFAPSIALLSYQGKSHLNNKDYNGSNLLFHRYSYQKYM